MGKLTANPRRFFGAFCVVNMLSEERETGAAPQPLITPRRRFEEASACAHALTAAGAAAGRGRNMRARKYFCVLLKCASKCTENKLQVFVSTHVMNQMCWNI